MADWAKPQLDPVVATYYSTAVKSAYDNGSILRPYVRVETGVVGGTAEFPRYGRGMARRHVPSTPRVPLGVSADKAIATLIAWDATEYDDRLHRTLVRFDTMPPLAEVVGKACGRRLDQTIIDPLIANFASATIPAGGVGMTEGKVREVVRLFDSRAVPRENRYLLVSATVYDQMRAIPTLTSRDFGETSVARTGQLPTVFGVTVIMMDDVRPEGGLPKSGAIRQCFAWDRMAVGVALGAEENTQIDWIPMLKSWQVNQGFTAGGVVIDPEGVIRVDCQE
jgi:hypothetical protein